MQWNWKVHYDVRMGSWSSVAIFLLSQSFAPQFLWCNAMCWLLPAFQNSERIYGCSLWNTCSKLQVNPGCLLLTVSISKTTWTIKHRAMNNRANVKILWNLGVLKRVCRYLVLVSLGVPGTHRHSWWWCPWNKLISKIHTQFIDTIIECICPVFFCDHLARDFRETNGCCHVNQ